jgi:O-methyltransferase domain
MTQVAEQRETGTSERIAVVSMALGYVLGQALHAAAALGIADLLAAGPRTIDDLAQVTDAHGPSLYRVLRTLASAGVFVEKEPGHFAQTSLSETLRADVPGSIRTAVIWINDPMHYRSCGETLRSVTTGQPAFDDVFGLPYFDYLAAHPDAARVWDAGMACFSGLENEAIAHAYAFPPGAQVADIGGGQGGFLAEVLETDPSLRGLLYDLPEVVADPRLLAATGLLERCETVGGDFFEFLPPGADCYVFKRVLHDWDDETCVDLLRRCRQVLPATGRLLVIDAVIPPGNDPHPAKIVDLIMLTALAGRERTEAEFGGLLAAAGFKLTRVIPTHSMLSIVEGAPA